MSVPHLDLSVPINSIENSSQRVRKGPAPDNINQRLERLIVDSTKRKNRIQRDGEVGGNYNKIGNKEIATVSSNQLDELTSNDNATSDKHNDDHQYSDIQDKMSNFAITSTGSRFNKEVLFNSTITIGQRKTAPTVNYLDKNKKKVVEYKNKDLIVSALVKAKVWHMQLRKDNKGSILSANAPSAKVAPKAKVNSNLRSSSVHAAKRVVNKSPSQIAKELSIKQDLKKMNTEEMKTNIKNHINSKYSEIEDILNANMAVGFRNPIDTLKGETINSQTNLSNLDQKPPVSALKRENKVTRPINFEFATAKRNNQRIADNKASFASNSQKSKIVNSASVNSIFKKFDINNDKVLSPEELRPFFNELVLQRPDLGLNKKIYIDWFNAIDQDKNGNMDPKELDAYLKSINYKQQSKSKSGIPTVPTQNIDLQSRPTQSSKTKAKAVARFTLSTGPVKASLSVQPEKPQAETARQVETKKIVVAKLWGARNSVQKPQEQQPVIIRAKDLFVRAKDYEIVDREEPRSVKNIPEPEQKESKDSAKRSSSVPSNSNFYIPKRRKLSDPKIQLSNNTPSREQFKPSPTQNDATYGSMAFKKTLKNAQQLEESSDLNASNPALLNSEGRSLNGKAYRSTASINLKSKEDVMNFDIENIWKEMEEIGRSKKAADGLFQAFQDKYSDTVEASQYYDQSVESPTRRLIHMKNATTKHHVIEYRKGITGRYAIQYTTCPEKSYVILPHQGETDYDQFNDKNAHKLVTKIINATVERVELQETTGKRLKSNPNARKVTNKSPVRINREYCHRGELIGGTFNSSGNNLSEVAEARQCANSEERIDQNSQDKPDIESKDQAVSRGVIFDENQNEVEEISFHEDSIINIFSNGMNSEGHGSVIVVEDLQQVTPIPTSMTQVPISQENGSPFHPDEQAIIDANYYANNGIPNVEEVHDVKASSDEEIPYANLQEEDQKVQLEAINEEEVKQSLVPITEAAEDEEQKQENPSEQAEEIASPENNGTNTPSNSEKRSGRRKGGKRRRY